MQASSIMPQATERLLGIPLARNIFPYRHGVIACLQHGDRLTASKTDVWHFVCDERKALWTWKRVSADGEPVAQSPYSFASFNVCVADAERAGFVNDTASIRRVWDPAQDAPTPSGITNAERRRRTRNRAR